MCANNLAFVRMVAILATFGITFFAVENETARPAEPIGINVSSRVWSCVISHVLTPPFFEFLIN